MILLRTLEEARQILELIACGMVDHITTVRIEEADDFFIFDSAVLEIEEGDISILVYKGDKGIWMLEVCERHAESLYIGPLPLISVTNQICGVVSRFVPKFN